MTMREKAALADDVVGLLTHRCAACKAGYKRVGKETQNHWKTTKHYMTYEQSRQLDGHSLYFEDGGYIYCNADLQEWLAKYDALDSPPTEPKADLSMFCMICMEGGHSTSWHTEIPTAEAKG